MAWHPQGRGVRRGDADVLRASWIMIPIVALALCAQVTMLAQPSRVIRRAAYERLYFPDTLGKMEIHYVTDYVFHVKATNSGTRKVHNFSVDITQARRCNPLTGARAYGFRATYTLEDTGSYVVERYSKLTAESGTVRDSLVRWNLRIDFPNLLAPLQVDSAYYPGESPVIAFATREFPEAQGYTYSLRQGTTVLDTGAGSNIFLQKFVNDPKYISREKVYEARGYYNGRIFSYLSGTDRKAHSSAWRFKILQPVLEDLGVLWSSDMSCPIDSLPVLPMEMHSAYNPRLFGFAYLTPKGNSFIFTNAKISNLRVQADPEEFLGSYAGPIFGATWTDIVIVPDAAFLQSGPRDEPKLVTLRFMFDTQLEKRRTFTYRALVY
jgi:hypothetical protein